MEFRRAAGVKIAAMQEAGSVPPILPAPGGTANRAPHPFGDIIRENVFTPYRERILYPAAAVGVLVLLPLAFRHFHEGNVAIAGLLLVLVAMMGVDVAATRRGKRPPIPLALLLMPAAAAVAIALATHGLYGALWAFPTVTFSYFVLKRRAANIGSIGMLLLGTSLLYMYQELGMALRFFLALGLVIVAINILLDVLGAVYERLLEQSVRDPSTGAYNRRHMETCVQHVIERHRRTRATASVLAIDIDRFGKVNDRFGVEGGDRVLRAFTELIRGRVRSQDLVFRSGGQQFLVLLPDTGAEEAKTLGEELRAMVAEAPLAEGHPLTVSVGVTELRDGDAIETWTRRAVMAMRHAKDEGRNRVMVAPAAEGA